MNNFTDSNGFLPSNDVNNFPFPLIIGISVGVLFLLTTLTIASYFCTRIHVPPPHHSVIDIGVGLEEQTIEGYPKMLYSESNQQLKLNSSDVANCCYICLADYKSSDMLRLLPDCSHLFHVNCVDPWLRLNPSCPVCRASPMPTPLSTPLAEVVSLTITRS